MTTRQAINRLSPEELALLTAVVDLLIEQHTEVPQPLTPGGGQHRSPTLDQAPRPHRTATRKASPRPVVANDLPLDAAVTAGLLPQDARRLNGDLLGVISSAEEGDADS